MQLLQMNKNPDYLKNHQRCCRHLLKLKTRQITDLTGL